MDLLWGVVGIVQIQPDATVIDYADGVGRGLADGRMELTGFSIDEVCTRDRFVNALSMVDGVVSVDSILLDDEEVTSITPDVDGVLSLGELTINQTVV